jgi:hypothetical protein
MDGKKGLALATIAAAIALCVVPAAGGAAVLYDQTSSPAPSGDAAQSQRDDAFPLNVQVADDFTVPAGQPWQIQSVDVIGHYFAGGPLSTVNVFLYSNAGTLPGAQLFAQGNIPSGPGTGGLSAQFTAPLTGAPQLGPGTYWVSVQANLGPFPANVWGWDARTVAAGSDAAFLNNGGGPVGCDPGVWETRHAPSCGAGAPASPDQLFRINGTVVAPTPAATPPASTPHRKRCKKHKKHHSAAAAKKCKRKRK